MKIKKYVALSIITLLLVSVFSIGLGLPKIVEGNEVEKDSSLGEYDSNEKVNLKVDIYGEGYVAIELDGEDHTVTDESTFQIVEGKEVHLGAFPDDGWRFSDCEGTEGFGSDRELTLTMDEDKQISTYFESEEYTLKIEEPVGNGSVEVDGEEINQWPYEKVYEAGTQVTLAAYPDDDWTFSHWGGPQEFGSDPEINLTMDEDKEIRAHFEKGHALTILEPVGHGSVEVIVDGETVKEVREEWTGYFEDGTEVNLNASPDDEYWKFNYWGGDRPGWESNITLLMDDDKIMRAYFVELFDLTVEKPFGEGNFTVEWNTKRENVTGNYSVDESWSRKFEKNTEVTLTAVPEDNWHFSHWRGDYPENEQRNESITIIMDTNKTIKGNFSQVEQVKIQPEENQNIIAGETINFTATAYDRYDYLVDDDDTNFAWQNTDEYGLFDETETGDYEVTATYEGVTSETTLVTVLPADPVEFWIVPENATIIAGESQEYTALVEDEFGNEFEVTEDATWSIDNEAGGEWDHENAIYEAEFAGEWVVEAEYNGMTDSANLEVQPADPAYIEISAEDETIDAGDSEEYTATAYDEYDNEIGDVTEDTDWSDDIPDSSWDENQITAYTAGEWTITANYEGLQDTSTLTVRPGEVYRVEIEPEEDQIIDAGDTIDFEAAAYDEYDNLITDDDEEFEWTNTDDTGLFDNTTAGEYEVNATFDDEETSDTVTVTVDPDEVDYVLIGPAENQTVKAGESIEFDASAYDKYDNLITDDPEEFNWTNAPNGVFEKFEAGEYEVKAEYGNVSSEPITVDNTSDVKPATILLSVILTLVVGVAVYQKVGGEK